MKRFVTVAMLSLAAVAGCTAGEAPGLETERPGAVVSEILACKTDAQCKAGETCGQGFCQMRRCANPSYSSVPPLGKVGYAATDRAFVVASDNSILQTISAYGTPSFEAKGSVLDVTGGNLTGARPESIAVLTSESTALQILSPKGDVKSLELGWLGKRLASGDVDGDGIDEVVVLGGELSIAICNAVRGSCETRSVNVAADDVAVADVDGDGFAEVVLSGNHSLTVVNANAISTGEKESESYSVTPVLVSISAGDLDGDGRAEIVGTERGGTVSWDKLHVFRVSGVAVPVTETELTYSVGNDALDVAVTKQDDKPVVGVLSNESTIQFFSLSADRLAESENSPQGTVRGRHIAAADVNGRSAIVRLKGKPSLEVGPPVPIAVITAPPYSATRSAGPSSATLGTSEENGTTVSNGKSKTNSVSLQLSAGLSIPAFGVLGSLSGWVGRSWSTTASQSKAVSATVSIGQSYTLTAEPYVDGFNSGGVVLAGGCFHKYDYSVDDPEKLLGSGTRELSTFVPVGGETTLWSTNRYNALVDALGGTKLPKVTIPTKLGSLESYPSKPMTLDGETVPNADNVFPKAPVTRTSDVGLVGFSLTSSESTTNTEAAAFSYGKSAGGSVGVNFPIVNVQGTRSSDTNWGLDQSYSVTVGGSTSFSGQVAPVRDDPSTPANEATIYGYSFQPVVYRHHFKTGAGKDGAFYVLTYTAAK